MNQLDTLQQHRNALLLAEAIGWLHDYRKCSDEHLRKQAANSSGQALSRNELSSRYPQLRNIKIQLLSNTRGVADWLDDRTWGNDLLGEYISRCHKTAHFDKQDPVAGKQNVPGIKMSTPLGFERNIPGNLTGQLWSLPWNVLASFSSSQRDLLREGIEALFSQTVADTRRPINEVDLWSWGLLVGALYKAALAGALLTGSTPNARDLRWRLLGVRVNGLDYLLKVHRIPDLLARQEIILDSLNRVRNLLEVTYPLGSEVYRDENGSIYVVPDVADLLDRTNSSGISLRKLILQEFEQGTARNKPTLQLGGEMTPHLELERTPWWGQDPGWPNSSNDELPDISRFFLQKNVSPANADVVRQFWQNQEATDICTVCGLRPQGPGQKAADRNVCDICEKRRADRSQEWVTSQSNKTIWTDEVADVNGRLALIVGRFDLTHWLDGSLLDSLLLIAPHDPENTAGKPITSKTASFSRLRRIWETTRRFWQEVQADGEQLLTDDRRRLKIYLNPEPDLGPFHVYDLMLGATDLSVVWVPTGNDHPGYLLTAGNLGYIAHQLGAEPAIYGNPATAAIFVEDYLRAQYVQNGQQPILRNPDRQAGLNLPVGIRITDVEYQEDKYATAIPILAEPRTFMIVVPADKSLGLVRAIKEKYEHEMGKVRDRLPIHLGVVYASRRTPIRAVLDAGRAMLDLRMEAQRWAIKTVRKKDSEVLLGIEHKDNQIQWRIPLMMGDGTTEDRWYPYAFLDTDGDDSRADAGNRRAVKITRPTGNGHTEDCWIVHAGDLREGEVVYVWPSTFDFEFLDVTSRRFEIYYDNTGQRTTRCTRPYYLEALSRLEMLWEHMKQLERAQRYKVISAIEATRDAWFGEDKEARSLKDEVFRRFVHDTLAGAAWPKEKPWNSIPAEWRDKLIQAGVRGELADLAELHMEILKE